MSVTSRAARRDPAKRKPSLITPPELAEYLAKSEGTLRNWRYLGRGPKWLKVGGHEVRYRAEDVDAWLQNECGSAA